MMRKLVFLAVLPLAGCTMWEPGLSLQVAASAPTGVSIGYNHWVDTELQAAINLATQHCAAYGKQAQLTGSSPDGVTGNRAIAHFTCN